MENYEAAHKCRLLDIDALLAGPNQRITTAAHIGGVVVECRLKALVLTYHKITAWDEVSKRRKDARFGHPIPRTGHGLIAGVRLMQDLFLKAKADPQFLMHLNRVTHPTGATAIDFIALRYSAHDMDRETLLVWRKSLDYVLGWLKKNENLL
jgi:hypothetical protein